MKVVLTTQQKNDLEKLWFIYGNGGPKHTLGNHKFIQNLIENKDYHAKFYLNTTQIINCLSRECLQKVDGVLDKVKIGDRVKINSDAIHQESQRPLNKLRGKIINIEQNYYIVTIDKFWGRLPFSGSELTKI